MRVHVYTGSLGVVAKSGVGQAVFHQQKMLEKAGASVTDSWRGRADAVHINTVFPDAVFAALRARARGETVVYYGHSTMQDFRDSFVGSNLLAPLFRLWLCFCYRLGDIVITPTPYSQKILESYGLRRPVFALSNGVDTEFFAPDTAHRAAFRCRWQLEETEKVVVSAGHFMERKGILEYIALAREMPQVRFLWFGYTDPALVPPQVKAAMAAAPANLTFAGYVDQAALRDAYCGADAFVFCSHEETEGIVVLEALACGIPTVLRDIPVYEGWLEDGKNVYKARDEEDFGVLLGGVLAKQLPDLTAAGRATAKGRSLESIGCQLMALYARADEARAKKPRRAPALRT